METPCCEACPGRNVDCLLLKEGCGITDIYDDESVGDEMPHPTEIEFNLKTAFAKFIGNQLLVWVDEQTLKALARMRKIDHAGTDMEGESELQGYLDDAAICFLTRTPGEWQEFIQRRTRCGCESPMTSLTKRRALK